jgi:hypothetical protein
MSQVLRHILRQASKMHIHKFSVLLLGAALACPTYTASSQVSAPTQGSPGTASSGAAQLTRPPRLPAEVKAAIKRLELCHHFAGEIGGDGTDRDKELGKALRRYRCDQIAETIKTLKRKYHSNEQVTTALNAAEEANQ